MGRRREQAALAGPAERDGPTAGPARASRFATLPFVWLALAAGLSGGFGLGAALLLPPLVGVPVEQWWAGPATVRVAFTGLASLAGLAAVICLGLLMRGALRGDRRQPD